MILKEKHTNPKSNQEDRGNSTDQEDYEKTLRLCQRSFEYGSVSFIFIK